MTYPVLRYPIVNMPCPRYPEKSADTDDDEASSTDSATEYSAIDTGDTENMYGGVHRQDQAYTVKWR